MTSPDDKKSGTLLVNCSGSACREVIQQSKNMEAVTLAFRVEKKTHDSSFIIHVKLKHVIARMMYPANNCK